MSRDYDRRLSALESGIETDDSEYTELLDRIVGRMVADGDNWITRGRWINDYATEEELAELKRVRPVNGSPRLDSMVKAAQSILEAAMVGPRSKKARVGEEELDTNEPRLGAPGSQPPVQVCDGPASVRVSARSAMEVPAPERQSIPALDSRPVAKSNGNVSSRDGTVPRHPWATAF